MACFAPMTAYYGDRGETGKRRITFQRAASFSGVPLKLPCGKCVGCRLERSRQWAMRCVHEAKMHKENCFVTLTYDDLHLPPGGSLVIRDLQLFMKRLRKARHAGVRFYACGEYGDLNRRPHYHALLFNCSFPDAVLIGKNGRDEPLYTSKELAGLWPYGFNTIGAVTFDSAAYVARYVMKKRLGKDTENFYEVMDSDGVVYDRTPEFTVMSRRPGIGSGYYAKYGHEVRAHDSVVINGREVRPPRFYDTRTDKADPALLEKIKLKRKRFAFMLRADNTTARLRVREVVALRKLHMKRRPV